MPTNAVIMQFKPTVCYQNSKPKPASSVCFRFLQSPLHTQFGSDILAVRIPSVAGRPSSLETTKRKPVDIPHFGNNWQAESTETDEFQRRKAYTKRVRYNLGISERHSWILYLNSPFARPHKNVMETVVLYM
jgi:hypothetical protein